MPTIHYHGFFLVISSLYVAFISIMTVILFTLAFSPQAHKPNVNTEIKRQEIQIS